MGASIAIIALSLDIATFAANGLTISGVTISEKNVLMALCLLASWGSVSYWVAARTDYFNAKVIEPAIQYYKDLQKLHKMYDEAKPYKGLSLSGMKNNDLECRNFILWNILRDDEAIKSLQNRELPNGFSQDSFLLKLGNAAADLKTFTQVPERPNMLAIAEKYAKTKKILLDFGVPYGLFILAIVSYVGTHLKCSCI